MSLNVDSTNAFEPQINVKEVLESNLAVEADKVGPYVCSGGIGMNENGKNVDVLSETDKNSLISDLETSTIEDSLHEDNLIDQSAHSDLSDFESATSSVDDDNESCNHDPVAETEDVSEVKYQGSNLHNGGTSTLSTGSCQESVLQIEKADSFKNAESSDTETCSEDDSSPIKSESKLDVGSLKNKVTKILDEKLQKITSINHANNKTLVTSFTLHDGSVIKIDEKFMHQPIVLELGNILDAFLQKIELKPELSGMISRNQNNEKSSPNNEVIQNLTRNCKQLEKQNTDLKIHLKQIEEKLEVHDHGAKRTIERLQKDFEAKMAEMSKKYSVAESEKQSSVMNFARREKELMDLRRQKEAAEHFAKSANREKEKAVGQLKHLKSEVTKLKSAHEKKETEASSQTKQLEKLKEEVNSQAIKVRWAQNKLKSEVESHKETKEKCDKMVLEIQQAKEETEQIRKNCQEMIKTYQESEEIKSNALDIELKEKNQIITTQEQGSKELQSFLKQAKDELQQVQTKLKNVSEENESFRAQLESLDQERIKNESKLRGYEEVLNKQKATAAQMNEKMQDIYDLQNKVEELNGTIGNLNDALHDAVVRRNAALADVDRHQKKEHELLDFTEKVSSKNSQLTVQFDELSAKLSSQNEDLTAQAKKIEFLQTQVDELTISKEKDCQAALKTQTTMSSRLEDKEKTICQLLLQLEELKDDMRTLKRKNAASVKDLTRQLNQVKRKSENTDALSNSSNPNSTNHSADGGSMGSRASSTTSLDRIPSYSSDNHISNYEHMSIPETTVTGPDSLDRQMLIERIVRLQQIHAKKNEKIDFLNEHVHQLVAALQKKQRLIQHYIMREESGALAPPREHHDSKRHGLTLELSMEINQKMQSVLEDTLLKNITLKESLETLGREVQRLSGKSAATNSS